MRIIHKLLIGGILLTSFNALATLESWQGESKRQIMDFVSSAVDPSNELFVPVAERIAVFDNDGTLWAEQPMYFQAIYAIDYIKKNAKDNPKWRDVPMINDILNGTAKDKQYDVKEILQMVMLSHGGMNTDQFSSQVGAWLATAKHPKTGLKYNEMIYQPMVELLTYLRENDFKTYIVSGGGVEFMRVWASDVYGIPPEQIIGSTVKTEYVVNGGKPQIMRKPEMDFLDDKAGKPVNINRIIGRKPVIAVGNSDGDREMLEWSTSGEGARLGILIHHTDSEREWAYDKDSHVGRLDQALNQAKRENWLVVDMKNDWLSVFKAASGKTN
ncbi:HAD family hydrolase [Pseudoalteromonas haloplanktis]|uniref:phosphoserine phosphatase n=1 Tax=Pseudoalteromonas haloplanktis TaxID=228 RepID=A0ABU1BHV6_PSEHA|nr:HAD family hydrolase [Pseudoalteromonas haloplanktis]MDQ9093177.1 HAD family hydrolase [Pseudoalteromonas haloplanktis]